MEKSKYIEGVTKNLLPSQVVFVTFYYLSMALIWAHFINYLLLPFTTPRIPCVKVSLAKTLNPTLPLAVPLGYECVWMSSWCCLSVELINHYDSQSRCLSLPRFDQSDAALLPRFDQSDATLLPRFATTNHLPLRFAAGRRTALISARQVIWTPEARPGWLTAFTVFLVSSLSSFSCLSIIILTRPPLIAC